MTMGVERTPTTVLNASSSSREEDQFEEIFSRSSRHVLSATFFEFREEKDTFKSVEKVVLFLTVDGELLVLKKTSDFPTKFSLLRKHDLRTSQIMEHPLLPNALRVEAFGRVEVCAYQVAQGSISKWISKLCSKAMPKVITRSRANTHSRGAKAAKNGLLPRSTRANGTTKPATASTAEGSSDNVTHSGRDFKYSCPSSPVAQGRSILSAVLASKSKEGSGSGGSLLEEEGEGGAHQEPEVINGGRPNQLASNGCFDEEDVLVIANGDLVEEMIPPLPPTSALQEVVGEESTLVDGDDKEGILMLVNGHADQSEADDVNGEGDRENGEDLDECRSEMSIDLSVNEEGFDLLRIEREMRSSLRLDLKKSPEITRTFSDRFLGRHRAALSSIEEGTILTRFPRSSSSASRLDDLRETEPQLTLEASNSPHLTNGETRSHGSSTPMSPPVTPTTPRTPSPLTPVPPSPPAEGNGFLGGRFHHMQIRNKKVKCSPRINHGVSVPATPTPAESSENDDVRATSLTALLTSSLPAAARPIPEVDRTRSCTPTHSSASPLAQDSSPRHPSGCSTLPRRRPKSKSVPESSISNTVANSMGQVTLSSSPVPAKHLSPKSPRLFRIFHRRWQSSSAIKVPLDFEDDTGSPSGSIPSTPVHGSSAHVPKKLHLYDSREVAAELSIIDGEMLRKIEPDELKHGAWMKKNKDVLAPNVMAMVRSFNQLALLVPSEILEEKTPQARAKVISNYIQIASRCYSVRNYNALKAVLAGLQCTPIFRLKKTWKEVPSKRRKRFDQLSELMSECDNGQRYQEEIEKLMAANESFIPFLGSFLTQVVHQESFDEIRAKREKSAASKSEGNSSQSSPSHEVKVPKTGGDDVVPKLKLTHKRSSSLMVSAKDKLGQEDDDASLSKSVPSSPIPIPHPNFDSLRYKKKQCLNDDGSEGLSFLSATSPTSSLATSGHSLGRTMYSFLPTGEDEVDWAGHSESSLAEQDSGLYSSSSHRSTSIPKSSSFNSFHDEEEREFESTLGEEGERCSSAAIVASGSEIELKELYQCLKRKSQSYESLLNEYTEADNGLKSVLHSTLTELARLSANLDGDSVLSENDDLGEHDVSSISLDISSSEVCSETSLLQNSFDAKAASSRLVQEFQSAMENVRAGAATESKAQREMTSPEREVGQREVGEKATDAAPSTVKSRPPLLRAQSEFTSLEEKIRATEREVRETSPKEECSETHESGEGKREKRKKKRSIHRSLSYNNSGVTKAMLRKRRRKKSTAIGDEDQSDGEKATKEPLSPVETLNVFKRASLGCAAGVESKTPLRSVICDTQPNSERDNYKLSVDREQ